MAHRPVCTLIVGNGFSIGLASHLGASKLMCLDVLLPPDNNPNHIHRSEYYEIPRPIWNSNDYPLLAASWAEWVKQCPPSTTARRLFNSFCAHLSSIEHINPDRDRGGITLQSATVSYQLRRYLWHIFSRNCNLLHNRQWNASSEWPWFSVLKYLSDNYLLRIVSYNYDCFIESSLKTCGAPFEIQFDPDPPLYMDGTVVRSIDEAVCQIVKPHGSITFSSLWDIKLNTTGPNIFLITGSRHINHIKNHHPTRDCPTLPDLVPPGHHLGHLANPSQGYSRIANDWLKTSEFIVLCGLSAEHPDTEEIDSLIGSCQSSVRSIHVGVGEREHEPSDEYNDAGKILRKYSHSYEFVDVRKPMAISSIPHLLKQI